MAYSDKYGSFFGRRVGANGVAIFHTEDGAPATRMDVKYYPIGSDLSARHEHPEGIILTLQDAMALQNTGALSLTIEYTFTIPPRFSVP